MLQLNKHLWLSAHGLDLVSLSGPPAQMHRPNPEQKDFMNSPVGGKILSALLAMTALLSAATPAVDPACHGCNPDGGGTTTGPGGSGTGGSLVWAQLVATISPGACTTSDALCEQATPCPVELKGFYKSNVPVIGVLDRNLGWGPTWTSGTMAPSASFTQIGRTNNNPLACGSFLWPTVTVTAVTGGATSTITGFVSCSGCQVITPPPG